MQSTRIASVGFAAAMMAACVASAGEKSLGVGEEKSLGVRLVDQMNALYGAHSGVRANHATGAVFEGTFTPALGADTLSSAAFLVGAPTSLTIRFSNAGGMPDAPDTDPSVGGIRGMAIKFHLRDSGENDIVALSARPFPSLDRRGISGHVAGCRRQWTWRAQTHTHRDFLVQSSGGRRVCRGAEAGGCELRQPAIFRRKCFAVYDAQGPSKFGRYRLVPVSGPAYVSDEEAVKRSGTALADNLRASIEKGPIKFRLLVQLAGPVIPPLTRQRSGQTVDRQWISVKLNYQGAGHQEGRKRPLVHADQFDQRHRCL